MQFSGIMRAPGGADLAFQCRVLRRVAGIGCALRLLMTGGHDQVQMAGRELGAGDERGDLLLLDDLPVDKRLDVGVVDVDDHHLGRTPRRAARFDRAGRAVADAQKAHQPGRPSAARQALAIAAQFREVRARARAVFENPRLAHPQIHDPALVDEIVGDRLDKAGVRLRVLVGAGRRRQLAAAVVDVVMALRRAVDAIGPIEPGVEPLRRVRGAHLPRQHQPDLVVKGAGVLLGVEIAALPSPIGPGPGHPVENLAGVGLAAVALILGQCRHRRGISHAPPQPRRNSVFLDRRQARRHPGFAEIFLGNDVAGDLAPFGRHLDSLGLEDDRAIGIANLAGRIPKRNRPIGILTCRGKAPRDMHSFPPKPSLLPAGFAARCSYWPCPGDYI